jgi:cytidylate kinase
MVNLLDRIKATKAAEEKPQDISLRGMGVTKRIAERDAKAYAREVEKATKTDDSLLKTDAELKFERAMHETIESLKQKQIGARR